MHGKTNGYGKPPVFIGGAEGIIRFKKIYPMREVPDIGEILDALAEV